MLGSSLQTSIDKVTIANLSGPTAPDVSESHLAVGLNRRLRKFKADLDKIWWVPSVSFYRYTQTKLDYINRRIDAGKITPYLLLVVDGLSHKLELEFMHYGRFSPNTNGEDPRPYIARLESLKPRVAQRTAALMAVDALTAININTLWVRITEVLESTRAQGLDDTLTSLLETIFTEAETQDDDTRVSLYPLNDVLKTTFSELRKRGRIVS